MNKSSLTKRIIYHTLILLPIPLLINLAIMVRLSFVSAKKDFGKTLQTEANNYLLSFKGVLNLNQLYLNQLEKTLVLTDNDKEENDVETRFKNISGEQEFIYHLVSSDTIITTSENNIVDKFLKSRPNIVNAIRSETLKNSFIIAIKNPSSHEIQSYLLTIKKLKLNQNTYYLIKSENILNIWDWIHKFKLGNEDVNVILTFKHGDLLTSSSPISFSCVCKSNTPCSKDSCLHLLNTKIKFSVPLSTFSLNNKKYFSYSLEDAKIDGLTIITYSSFQEIIQKTLQTPIKIFSLFIVTFTIGGILIWIITNKMSKPLYRLSLCMHEVKNGNYARFSPLPFGGEFNYIGDKFNKTLGLLLESIENTEQEKIKRTKLEHELSIINQIQEQILFPLPLEISYISNQIIHIPGSVIKGVFQEWQEIKLENNNKILRYGIGIANGTGLSSCLYSIASRSLFLVYSQLLKNLYDVIQSTQHDFCHTLSSFSDSLNMFAFDYHPQNQQMDYIFIGQRWTIIQKYKEEISVMSSVTDSRKNSFSKTVHVKSGEELLIVTEDNHNLSSSDFSEKKILSLLHKDKEKTIDSLVSEIKDIYILDKKNKQEVIITILNIK